MEELGKVTKKGSKVNKKESNNLLKHSIADGGFGVQRVGAHKVCSLLVLRFLRRLFDKERKGNIRVKCHKISLNHVGVSACSHIPVKTCMDESHTGQEKNACDGFQQARLRKIAKLGT